MRAARIDSDHESESTAPGPKGPATRTIVAFAAALLPLRPVSPSADDRRCAARNGRISLMAADPDPRRMPNLIVGGTNRRRRPPAKGRPFAGRQ